METETAAATDRLDLSRLPASSLLFERKASKDLLGTAVVSLDVIDGQQRIIALTQFRNDG
jgi:hypothetical protein